MTRAFLALGTATVLTIAGIAATAPPSHADPVLHDVKYIVTAQTPFYAEIYYIDSDPPNFGVYSHNPYEFAPNVEANVGPGAPPWTVDVKLADPNQWAMVTATSGPSPATPMFHCELAVDGVVAVSNAGPKGALCSLRTW